uniref:Glutaredoxin-2, mitochondrial n=2 Tax=Anopheles atroparvus TaxID=41427 RepID=A0A182J3M7_ANOAO
RCGCQSFDSHRTSQKEGRKQHCIPPTSSSPFCRKRGKRDGLRQNVKEEKLIFRAQQHRRMGVGRSVPANMSGPVAEFVKSAIAKDKVVIFSKTYCPYCTMAKEPFKKLNKEYACYELDKRNDGDEIQSVLGEMTGARTVPRVFIDGNFVGGGTDIKKMFEDGRLAKMLA